MYTGKTDVLHMYIRVLVLNLQKVEKLMSSSDSFSSISYLLCASFGSTHQIYLARSFCTTRLVNLLVWFSFYLFLMFYSINKVKMGKNLKHL